MIFCEFISLCNIMNTFLLNNIIKKFLLRFFFILNAASNGWGIRYVGGDEFIFYKSKNKITELKSINNFINNFRYNLI